MKVDDREITAVRAIVCKTRPKVVKVNILIHKQSREIVVTPDTRRFLHSLSLRLVRLHPIQILHLGAEIHAVGL